MNINIAKNLKALRIQKELTQETLAQFIGVSSQAISKWERNEGYPDITILPVIANFFHVTIDDLVGMEEIRSAQQLKDIKALIRENWRNGKIEDNITLIRGALKQYPDDHELIYQLASNLFSNRCPDNKNCLEASEICERLLLVCKDMKLCDEIKHLLCLIYKELGENEKGIRLVETFPSLYTTYQMTYPFFLTGDKKVREIQVGIQQLLGLLIHKACELNDCQAGKISLEERLEILTKAIDLIKVVYDKGDHHGFNWDMAHINRRMANICLEKGDMEQAICFLEELAKYTIAIDTAPNQYYSSSMVDKLEYNTDWVAKSFDTSVSQNMCTYYLQQPRYDQLREHPKFIALIEELNKH